MTLPLSGNISIADVATELGVALPLSLEDSRVLNLAGKASPPISLSDLYGKSAYTPMTVTGVNSSVYKSTYKADGSAIAHPSVNVTGGSGGCTFMWSFTSNLDSCTLSNAQSQTCAVAHTYLQNSTGAASATLQCVVKDDTGHSVTVTGVTASLDWG